MKVQILACLLYRVLFPSRNADESSDSVFKEATKLNADFKPQLDFKGVAQYSKVRLL